MLLKVRYVHSYILISVKSNKFLLQLRLWLGRNYFRIGNSDRVYEHTSLPDVEHFFIKILQL